MSSSDLYYPESWPTGLAPARWEVRFTDDGCPYPYADLWVAPPASAYETSDDLWSSYSIPVMWTTRASIVDAGRRAMALARGLEVERDEVIARAFATLAYSGGAA